jgi:hypothetical protein
VTVTVTLAAKLVLVEVIVEVFTVPKMQVSVPLVTAGPQVPWLALAEVVAFIANLSVKTTPLTGSPLL